MDADQITIEVVEHVVGSTGAHRYKIKVSAAGDGDVPETTIENLDVPLDFNDPDTKVELYRKYGPKPYQGND